MKEPCYCYQQYNRTELNSGNFPNPDPIFLDDDPLGKLLSNGSFDLNGTLAELVNSTPLVSSNFFQTSFRLNLIDYLIVYINDCRQN